MYKLMGFFYFQQQMQVFREELVDKWVVHEEKFSLNHCSV